ncbi:MAG: hypothetical protein AABY22_16615 [Nanoarchaeota archaeon]
MGKKLFLLIFTIIFISEKLISAEDIRTWQGQYSTNGVWNNNTYSFNFTIYDNITSGNICYSNTTSLNTDMVGYWTTNQYNILSSCPNASINYYLNINIGGTDQPPRRLLDRLRLADRSLNSTFNRNVTASNFFGFLNWSWLQNIPLFSDINLTNIFYSQNTSNDNYYSNRNLTNVFYNQNTSNQNLYSGINLTNFFYTQNTSNSNLYFTIANFNDYNTSLINSSNVFNFDVMCQRVLGATSNLCTLTDTIYNDLAVNNTIANVNSTSLQISNFSSNNLSLINLYTPLSNWSSVNSSLLNLFLTLAQNSTLTNLFTTQLNFNNLNTSIKNSTNVLTNFIMCQNILGANNNLCTLTDTIYNDLVMNNTIQEVNRTYWNRTGIDITYPYGSVKILNNLSIEGNLTISNTISNYTLSADALSKKIMINSTYTDTNFVASGSLNEGLWTFAPRLNNSGGISGSQTILAISPNVSNIIDSTLVGLNLAYSLRLDPSDGGVSTINGLRFAITTQGTSGSFFSSVTGTSGNMIHNSADAVTTMTGVATTLTSGTNAGTITNVRGFGVNSVIVGDGSTFTTFQGIRIATPTGLGTITTATGIRIENMNKGTTNWAIDSAGGQSRHTGNFRIGDTNAPKSALDILGNVSISGNLTVDTNTLFISDFNNRVGIGTLTPTTELHVVGNINTTGNITAQQINTFANNSNSGFDSCTLSSGKCTISNTRVTSKTMIFCMSQNTSNIGALGIILRNDGVNYTVNSSRFSQSGWVACMLIEG